MKNLHPLRLLRPEILAASIASLLSIALPATNGAVSFLGVAAGDVSTSDATVWSRAVDSNLPGGAIPVTLQVSTDQTFSVGVTSQALTTTSAAAGDNTVKATIAALLPGARYYYRFMGSGGELSNVGTFKTAPTAATNYPLHFAFSGDCDGLIRPYALASQLAAKQLDFFMFDGDTEYETSASIGSAAVTSTGNIPAPSATGATSTQLFNDFSRKYREQFLPVNAGGQNCLQSFFAGQGNYTAYDNHELGNKQYINGGAPAGGAVGDFASGAGVDARVSTFDVNTSGTYMNKTGGFQTMQNVFLNYQPVKDRGTISAPSDANSNGTKQLYSANQWGRNAILINTDCRSYRDIRMKTAANADDTGTRADAASRTMLGKTQLAWLKQTLLAAEQAGTAWKFVNISDPIDQIGPIAGALSLTNAPTSAEYGSIGNVTSGTVTASSTNSTALFVTAAGASQNGYGLQAGQPISGTGIPSGATISSVNVNGSITLSASATVAAGTVVTLTGAPNTYAAVSSDGGKSWIGGYRAERNALLKFIADNQIKNVVFLATDDHQNRVNEITYSPTGQTGAQSTYVKVPSCFEIVCGPLGATGPDLISNHTFALAKKLSDSLYNAEVAAGVEPIGLQGYPGLHNVQRDVNGTLTPIASPETVDFYSPDTFNYNILDLSPDGKTLTVTSEGINSTFQNTFAEYDAANNPERVLFSFQVDAAPSPLANIDHFIVIYQENWSFDALYGNFPGANGVSRAGAASTTQIDRLSGNPLSGLPSVNGFNRYTGSGLETPANTVGSPGYLNIPPQPLGTPSGATSGVDTRFLTNPADATSPTSPNTLLPYDIGSYITTSSQTGDIVHRYWQEMFQIGGADVLNVDHGSNSGFITWSDNPGLVMSRFDATNLPEGLLAQQYTMCDNFFHSAFGGSFLNHQFVIAARAPVYTNMPGYDPVSGWAGNTGTLAYLDQTGLVKANTSGNDTSGNPAVGKLIRDGSITPVAGDTLIGLRINGVANQTATVGANATPSDVSFQDGSHFDKHYVVNTSFSRALATNTTTFATSATGNLDSTSFNVTGASGTRLSSNNVGMTVTGTGIPAGTVVTSFSGGTLGLSKKPTVTQSGVALTFSGFPVSLIPLQDNSATPLNIGDLLDNAGASWAWYSGGWNNALDSSPSNPLHFGSAGPNTVSSLFQWHHQVFSFFAKSAPFDYTGTYADGRNPYATLHLKDEGTQAAGTGIYGDIANNNLPQVSFVKFLGSDNEHPGYASLQQGQQHVADLVSAVQANPALWAHTAIIVTYDEHGGRWDHVTPPARDLWGPGSRVPTLVISPLAKQGFVDHTQYDTSSILKTIEQRFSLPSLTSADAGVNSLAGIFATDPASVARGGFVSDRRTGKITQQLTVTNNGSVPLQGPIDVALDYLSANTTLTNANGTTANSSPSGSPFVTVSAGNLAPGASVTVSLQFSKPASGAISYGARVVTGTANP